MINIIKRGNPPIARFECKICGCIWEASVNEKSCERIGAVKRVNNGNVRTYLMPCPTCGSGILGYVLKSDDEDDIYDS